MGPKYHVEAPPPPFESLRLPQVLIKPRKTISSALVAEGGGYAIKYTHPPLPLYHTQITGMPRVIREPKKAGINRVNTVNGPPV